MRSPLPLIVFLLLFLLPQAPASGADFVVTNTNSTGPGSLHEAITAANNLPGPDRILFNIPGAGVHKIKAGQTRLPVIYESLTIDGYSQPGAKQNSLAVGNNAIILIQIDGLDATTPGGGLSLERGGAPDGQTMLASNYVVRGLSLTGFSAEQTISFPPATYRSTALAAWGNVDSAVITGNFIGLLPDGETAGPNGLGMVVSHSRSTKVTVGGTDPASRNVISGNTRCGWSGGGHLLGNYIGTNAMGTRAIPNQRGLFLVGDGTGTMIGGTTAGSGNLISGNTVGIYFGDIYVNPNAPSFFLETPGSNFRIKGNSIGVQADGISRLPNGYSIQFLWGSNNIIGGLEPGAGNLITFNRTGIKLARPYVNRRGRWTGPAVGGQPDLVELHLCQWRPAHRFGKQWRYA